jgi:N-acetylmuramoyl-L-alanine amidase
MLMATLMCLEWGSITDKYLHIYLKRESTMTIRNHRWTGAEYIESPNRSGGITPKFIVQHYTAGYTASSAIDALTLQGSSVSAHLVIDLDGTVTQLVPFDVKAWHAGPSRYQGYNGLNNHSIGIEIVNIGWLRPLRGGKVQDAYGNVRDESYFEHGLVEAANSAVGSGTYLWPVYPEEQLKAVEEVTRALIATYSIIDVVSHEEIDTRGWKTDPGPAFPMRRFKSMLPDRSNDSDCYRITAGKLNVRSGPGTQFGVIGSVNKGDIVEIEAVSGDWGRIDSDGWIHTGYLQRV